MKLLLGLVLMAVGLAAQSPAKLTPIDQVSYPKMIASHHGKVVLANFWPPGACLVARRCRNWFNCRGSWHRADSIW